MTLDSTLRRALFAALVAAIPACVSSGESQDDGRQSDDIIAGTGAQAYPEAVLVDLLQGSERVAACSGSLVAPTVVLTAGHCVHTWSHWHVSAPHAGGQSAMAVAGATYDWDATGESVDPGEHDVGLIFLSSPIQLTAYPELARKPLAAGAKLLNLGRIHHGQVSDGSLFVSKPVTVAPGAQLGFPYDYAAVDRIEPGDSGGPDMLPGAAPHTIVAVNSGGNSSTEVLARVDLVASWIDAQISAHGGGKAPKPGKPTTTPAPTGPKKPGPCAHDPGEVGAALEAACSPCVAVICAQDTFCCADQWDLQCAIEGQGTCPGNSP